MPQWRDFPLNIRRQILREFCDSIIFDYIKYHLKFRTGTPYAIVWDEPYPRPLVNYINAQLTCREFHQAITTDLTDVSGRPPSLTLQTIQYKKLLKYSEKLFDEGSNDYREITLAQAMFGCFWKNPYVSEEYAIFDDMFGGLDKTGRLVLVCLSGGVLEKCKEHFPSRRGEYIKVQMKRSDRSFRGLVFSAGSHSVEGDCMCFRTVSSYAYATFQDHDLNQAHGFYDSDEGNTIKILQHGYQSEATLPDISASEPDTWWLARNIGGNDDWKEWYLVNYKEEKVIVGPKGEPAEWPDYFDLESLHLWQPEFLEFGDDMVLH